MSHTGKDVTWNRLFGSDPHFAKDRKGRTVTGDYGRGWYAALDAAREAVLAYADDTHQHVGMLKCWPENGDRCDITAALRVAAQRIDDLREDTK